MLAGCQLKHRALEARAAERCHAIERRLAIVQRARGGGRVGEGGHGFGAIGAIVDAEAVQDTHRPAPAVKLPHIAIVARLAAGQRRAVKIAGRIDDRRPEDQLAVEAILLRAEAVQRFEFVAAVGAALELEAGAAAMRAAPASRAVEIAGAI